MTNDREREIWERLSVGQSLDGLGLARVDGRWDLRGVDAPKPSVVKRHKVGTAVVEELRDSIAVRGVSWKGIDFSRCCLDSLRLFDAQVEDCSFDEARCHDWRLWGTTVSNTTFRGADLRGSALGGVEGGKRNAFVRVDYSKADLRRTVYVSADMVECIFDETKLDGVDFQGTVFTNCIFRGALNEVLFYRRAFRGERFPVNEMKGVDFSGARFRLVEFRGLDMNDVRWPSDSDHVVFENYAEALDKMLATLGSRPDVPSKRLAAILRTYRKWVGPHQKRGVLSKRDLVEAAGEKSAAEALRAVQS